MFFLSDFNQANFARKVGSKDKRKRLKRNHLGFTKEDIKKERRKTAIASLGGLAVGGTLGAMAAKPFLAKAGNPNLFRLGVATTAGSMGAMMANGYLANQRGKRVRAYRKRMGLA